MFLRWRFRFPRPRRSLPSCFRGGGGFRFIRGKVPPDLPVRLLVTDVQRPCIAGGKPFVRVKDGCGCQPHFIVQPVVVAQQDPDTALVGKAHLAQVQNVDGRHAVAEALAFQLRRQFREDLRRILHGGFRRCGVPFQQGIVAAGHQDLPHCGRKIGGQRAGQHTEVRRLGQLHPQDLQGVAQDEPSPRIHAGESLSGRTHLEHHGAGQLDIHLHRVKIRELRLQLPGLFLGRKTKQIAVLLDPQRGDDLILGIDAGIGRCAAVEVFHPEGRHFEQQVHRYNAPQHQYRQYGQQPQRAAAVAAAQDLGLGDPPLPAHARAARYVPRFLRVELRLRTFLRPCGAGGRRRRLLRTGAPVLRAGRRPGRGAFLQAHAAAQAALCGRARKGAAPGFLLAASLVAIHGRWLLS